MDAITDYWVATVDELAAMYKQPTERVLNKERDYVDALGRAFIAASPFLILASGGPQGFDCSPKGDKPRFRPDRGRRPDSAHSRSAW